MFVAEGGGEGNHGKDGKIVARLWFEFQSNGLWMSWWLGRLLIKLSINGVFAKLLLTNIVNVA